MFGSLWKKLRSFADDRGAVSVEFSFVVLPFIGTLLAIVESQLENVYQTHLDHAVQRFANDLRSGNAQLTDYASATAVQTLLSTSLCPAVTIIPGFDCSKVQVQLYVNKDCRGNTSATSCWNSSYDNFSNAVRTKPSFAATILGSSTFTIGSGGDSQYLVVYYPFPQINQLFTNSAAATVNGVRVYGLFSTAMWINDASVGVYN